MMDCKNEWVLVCVYDMSANFRLLPTCASGSLVLGQNQECYGGCFSPQYQLHGDMAVLRIWERALGQVSFESLRV